MRVARNHMDPALKSSLDFREKLAEREESTARYMVLFHSGLFKLLNIRTIKPGLEILLSSIRAGYHGLLLRRQHLIGDAGLL